MYSIFFFFAPSTLQRTSSTASVYRPRAAKLFFSSMSDCITRIRSSSFYGAIAKYFVPDNLKTAVTKHTKDELILQSTFADLEYFYEIIVLPPPARKPKGKPTVENHVRYLETHRIEKLKEKIYVSFEDLNADIPKIVVALNERSCKADCECLPFVITNTSSNFIIKQSLKDNHIFDCLSSSVYLLVLQVIHYYSAFDFANIAISPTPFKTIVGRYA